MKFFLSQYLFLYHDVPKHLYLKKVSEGRSVGSLDSRVQSMPLYYNVMTQQKDYRIFGNWKKKVVFKH